MAFNELFIGSVESPKIHFTTNDGLAGITGTTAVDLIGQELSIDTLTASVKFDVIIPRVFKPTDYDGILTYEWDTFMTYGTADIAALPYGTPVYYYSDYRLIGEFYITSVNRTAKDRYVLNCESFIGLLDKKPFYGGLYDGATFETVVRAIYSGDALEDYEGFEELRLTGTNSVHGDNYGRPYFDHLSFIELKFKFLGVGEDLAGSTALNETLGILGYMSSVTPTDNYALTCSVTRDSASSAWTYGKLRLSYRGQVLEGPVLVPGTIYEVTIDPIGSPLLMYVNSVPYDMSFPPTGSSLIRFVVGATEHQTSASTSTYHSCMSDLYYCHVQPEDLTQMIYLEYPTRRISSQEVGMFDSNSKIFAPVRQRMYGSDASVRRPVFVPEYGFNNNIDTETTDLLNSISYDAGVADYHIFGWIPAGTKREALQQLLFASSANLIKDEYGKPVFTWLNYRGLATTIENGRNYIGGSWDYSEKANEVDITEHTFLYDEEENQVTLFDNTEDFDAASGLLLIFSQAPVNVSTLVTTGTLRLLVVNPNCAVISGRGTLSGIPYKHIENIVHKKSDTGVPGKTVSVSSATLVSQKNSETVLDRLFEYFTKKESFTKSIVHNGERCGTKYRLTNPFNETSEGIMTQMNFNVSGIVKADCEFVTNFAPQGADREYEHSTLLTGSGTFTVPDGVTKMKIVLIGGGSGGESGLAGENGKRSNEEGYDSAPRRGGSAGAPGAGGKIATYVITNPDASYSYFCGEGGEGGEECSSHTSGNAGEEGRTTSFGSLTSYFGTREQNGYLDYSTGRYYGAKPKSQNGFALAGQDSVTRTSSYDSAFYTYPTPKNLFDSGAKKLDMWRGIYKPDSDYTYSPGVLPTVVHSFYPIHGKYMDGGWPGGAAAGQNGGNGTAPEQISWYEYGIIPGDGGDGGNALTPGIDALQADPKHYGWGGFGGNGGGAGGNASDYQNYTPYRNPTVGQGGKGSRGGKGGDGCIFVYW